MTFSFKSTPIRRMSRSEFTETLKNRKGGNTFVTLSTITVEKTKKSLKGTVTKKSTVNGAVGFSYENSVNYQRIREGNEEVFVAAPRQWGRRVTPALVEHKGNFYLTIKVEKNTTEPEYFLDGVPVDKSEVEKHFYAKRGSSRQGVEKEVVYRDYSISSILSVRMDGEEIELTD